MLNLADSNELTAAWHQLHENIAARMPGLVIDGILVERMGRKGTELIVGARNDCEWGPVLLLGFGGVFAEALKDVRLLPANLCLDAIVNELYQLKSAALLRGFRGAPRADVRAVAEIARRLGDLMNSAPAIREIDINPVVVYPVGEGAVALDALIVTES